MTDSVCCLKPITDDDVDRIATCIRVLADQSPLMFHVFNDMCRQSLAVMLSVKADEEKEFQKVCRVCSDGDVSLLHVSSKQQSDKCAVGRYTIWNKSLIYFGIEGRRIFKYA